MILVAEYEGPVTFQQEEKTIAMSYKVVSQVYVRRHIMNM